MPRIKGQQTEAEKLGVIREMFFDRRQWQYSRTGNLWRWWDGNRITVFRRYGRFSWAVNSELSEAYYSDEHFETEDDAMVALADELLPF